MNNRNSQKKNTHAHAQRKGRNNFKKIIKIITQNSNTHVCKLEELAKWPAQWKKKDLLQGTLL